MSLAPYQTNTVYTMLIKNKYGDWPNQNSKCSSCKDTLQSHESSSRPLTLFLHTRRSVTEEQSHRQQWVAEKEMNSREHGTCFVSGMGRCCVRGHVLHPHNSSLKLLLLSLF